MLSAFTTYYHNRTILPCICLSCTLFTLFFTKHERLEASKRNPQPPPPGSQRLSPDADSDAAGWVDRRPSASSWPYVPSAHQGQQTGPGINCSVACCLPDLVAVDSIVFVIAYMPCVGMDGCRGCAHGQLPPGCHTCV